MLISTFRKLTAFVAGSSIISGLPQQALADGNYSSYHGGGWGHMMFGSSMMIIALALIVFFIVVLVRWFGSKSDQKDVDSTQESAEEVLRHRFARGEIDKDEYEERMRTLKG